ncbi:MAG: hypothetical protein MK082_08445 [Phycisphaerales bacterium]|nr:hypothetical protein [Phycisphaerales bacterium]
MFPINAIFQAKENESLGTRAEIVARLSQVNTRPEQEGGATLYGPGILVSMHPDGEEAIKNVFVDETGQVERELAQLSLDRIERAFPEWIRVDDPPVVDDEAETEEFSLDEFLDD